MTHQVTQSIQVPLKNEDLVNDRAFLKRVAIGCLVATVIFGVLAGVFMHKGNIRALENRTLCSIGLSNCALATIALISAIILACKASPDAVLVGQEQEQDQLSRGEDAEEDVGPQHESRAGSGLDVEEAGDRNEVGPELQDPPIEAPIAPSWLSVEEARAQMLDKSGHEIADLIAGAQNPAPFLEALTGDQIRAVTNVGRSEVIVSKMPKNPDYKPDEKFSVLKFKDGREFARWIEHDEREAQGRPINFFWKGLNQAQSNDAVDETKKLFGQNRWGNKDTDYRKRVETAYKRRDERPILYTRAITR